MESKKELPRIVKASPAAREEYKGQYPLYGYVLHDGHEYTIELFKGDGDHPARRCAKYKVLAPKGKAFFPGNRAVAWCYTLLHIRRCIFTCALEYFPKE